MCHLCLMHSMHLAQCALHSTPFSEEFGDANAPLTTLEAAAAQSKWQLTTTTPFQNCLSPRDSENATQLVAAPPSRWQCWEKLNWRLQHFPFSYTFENLAQGVGTPAEVRRCGCTDGQSGQGWRGVSKLVMLWVHFWPSTSQTFVNFAPRRYPPVQIFHIWLFEPFSKFYQYLFFVDQGC